MLSWVAEFFAACQQNPLEACGIVAIVALVGALAKRAVLAAVDSLLDLKLSIERKWAAHQERRPSGTKRAVRKPKGKKSGPRKTPNIAPVDNPMGRRGLPGY